MYSLSGTGIQLNYLSSLHQEYSYEAERSLTELLVQVIVVMDHIYCLFQECKPELESLLARYILCISLFL